MRLEGGCFCGKVRYVVEGAPFHSTLCHCVDCRRVTGAPVVAWFSVGVGEIVFSGAPVRFASSPGVMRSFCGGCGTPLTFQEHEGELDVATCTLDDPEAMPPVDHTRTGGQLGWLRLADDLPRHVRLRGDDVA